MNPPLLLFIEPIKFHNTLQFNTEYNYLFLRSPFNKTKHKATPDQDNTIGHNTSIIKRQNIPTQHNKHETKETCLVNKTLHNTREMQWNSVQYNTEHITTQHDTMWSRTQSKIRTLPFKMFLKNFETIFIFSQQICFQKKYFFFTNLRPDSNDLIARCLFFPWIWDHKGIIGRFLAIFTNWTRETN